MPDEWKQPCGTPNSGGDAKTTSALALTWGSESWLSLAHSSKATGRARAATQVTVPNIFERSHSRWQFLIVTVVCVLDLPGRLLCHGSRVNSAASLFAMFDDTMSQDSSLGSDERSLVLHLVLTTLPSEELQVSIDLKLLYSRIYHTLGIWCSGLVCFGGLVVFWVPWFGVAAGFVSLSFAGLR